MINKYTQIKQQHQYKKGDKKVNKEQYHYKKWRINKTNKNTTSNLFTFIEISPRQRHILQVYLLYCLPCDITLKTEQATVIQLVLCEDTFRVNRIIMVWRSLL